MPLESKVVAIRVNRVCVCVSLFCFYSFFLCAGKDVQVFRVFGRNPKPQNRHNFFFRGKQRTCHEEREKEERTIMGGRRKNPNPKRAENARTVLKGDAVLEERGGGEEEEEEEPEVLLCLRIPDDEGDADEVNEQMRKEEMTVRKGAKRKRGQHECGVCEKCLLAHLNWPYTCVFTRTRGRINVMCARRVVVNLVLCKATCAFTRTRNRTSVMCARSVLLHLVV